MFGTAAAQDDAAARQEGIRLRRAMLRVSRKMNEDEIADARRHLEAEPVELPGQPGQPFIIVRDRALDMRLVGNRRRTCSKRR